MPRQVTSDMFKKMYQPTGKSLSDKLKRDLVISNMATEFSVSKTAMKYRLQNIGIL